MQRQRFSIAKFWVKETAICALALCLVFFAACGNRAGVEPGAAAAGETWLDLLDACYRLESFPKLDQPGAGLISSYDRTGGNDDYNHGLIKGPSGWVILADLPGPGYVSRFWCTGVSNSQHRFRFYFDSERSPRLDLSLAELCGERLPFIQPFAANENFCWFNMMPVPFAKRLLIMAQDPFANKKDPKFYYQINHHKLPQDRMLRSFPRTIGARDLEGFEAIRKRIVDEQAWNAPDFLDTQVVTQSVVLAADASHLLPRLDGPGILRRIDIRPRLESMPSANERDRSLREVVLSIRWDDEAEPSVLAPIGDFFGSVWRRTSFRSFAFGMANGEWACRFPMPFARAASMRLENQGALPFAADVRLEWARIRAWHPSLGYFHAAWNCSGPDQVGRPHVMLRAAGAGKYVGCVMAAWSLDRSFWLLEGDEIMFADGRQEPVWHGTGLEDYFNGGWYYQNVLARPLHGLTHKTFFKTIQYRLHLADPVAFGTSLDVLMERGPDNASHGWLESLVFYYLARPSPAAFRLPAPPARQPPPDEFAAVNFMMELFNCERFGEYEQAIEMIDAFLPRLKGSETAALLALRRLAYMEETQGFEAVKPLYAEFMANPANAAALDQAKLLQWRHEAPGRALFGLYANIHTRAFLDGREILKAGAPERMSVAGVELQPGEHVLALQFRRRPYPDWVQACLKFRDSEIITTPDWRMDFNPQGDWAALGYDDTDWRRIGEIGVKGPPEEPYIYAEPNAFVNMQSKAVGLRPTGEWPTLSGFCVFRHRFTVPECRRDALSGEAAQEVSRESIP